MIFQSFDTNQDLNTYLCYTLVCKLMLLKRLLCLYNFSQFFFTLAILQFCKLKLSILFDFYLSTSSCNAMYRMYLKIHNYTVDRK